MRDIRCRGTNIKNINSSNKDITEICNKRFLCRDVIIEDKDIYDFIKEKEKIYDETTKTENNNDNN